MAQVYAIKTTVNQEMAVADMIERAIRIKGRSGKKGNDGEDLGIKAILAPDELKGYVLVEAFIPEELEEIVQSIPHARGLVKERKRGKEGDFIEKPISTNIEEVEHFLTPKHSVTGIAVGNIIEIVSGPFKGEKARVKRVDEVHEEITIELFEAMVPIPITVRGDSVRVLSKEGQSPPNKLGGLHREERG